MEHGSNQTRADFYTWKNYTLFSTVNGMALASQETKKKRSVCNFGVLAVGLMILLATSLTVKAFVVYLSYSIDTKITMKSTRDEFVFPGITICPSVMSRKKASGQCFMLLNVPYTYYAGSMEKNIFFNQVGNSLECKF